MTQTSAQDSCDAKADTIVDTIVIGAGFAGLACGAALQRAGHRVRVLEARDRIGGRVRSATLAGRRVDVGGQWIGAGHDRLRALAGTAGVSVVPQYGEGSRLLHLSGDGARMRRYKGLIPKVSPWALIELQLALRSLVKKQRRLDLEAPWKTAQAARWDSETLASWARRRFRSRQAREVFDIAVRAVLTSEPSALSFLYFLFYCASNGDFEALGSTEGGAQAHVVAGGMIQVAAHLAQPIQNELILNAPVRAIAQSGSGVTVITDHERYAAERVVVAIPPALQAGIEFSPALPVARERLAAQMPMGSVIKAVIAYDRPFWRDAGLCGEAVSHTLAFNTVFDASWPTHDGAALVGFFDGKSALDYADAAPEVRRQAVIDSLVDYFGEQARTPVDYVDYNWLADPWAKGCYTGVMGPGVMTTLGQALREPCGRIYWAGTETATQWCGYIEGALHSGERAAAQVLAA